MPSLTSMSLGMSNQISPTFSNAVNSTTTSLQITIPCKYVDRHTVNIRPLTALRAISSLQSPLQDTVKWVSTLAENLMSFAMPSGKCIY